VNLVMRALAPTSLYSAAIGAHKPWFGAPDQHAERGSRRAVWLDQVRDQPNIHPLISALLLTLYFVLYSIHHGSVHRACFIVTAQLPIESDSYNIPLCFETNYVPFGPLMIKES
jgi:hypothetical protein